MTPATLLAYLIPLVMIGLTVADFIPDQHIDKFLIGALLIFGLGALGWRLDDILGKDGASAISKAIDPTNADDGNVHKE